MKRFFVALAAAAAVTVPLAAATDAFAQRRDNDRREWRDDRGRNNDRWDNRGNRGWDDRRDNRGRNDWNNNRGRNDSWNDNRRYDNRRWDNGRHNGYYLGNRWYYGPPPQAYYTRYDFRPDYRPWSRGGYLPPVYRNYVIYDYGRYRLRPPPRGYHWVQHNNDYILAAIATGLILEVISNGF